MTTEIFSTSLSATIVFYMSLIKSVARSIRVELWSLSLGQRLLKNMVEFPFTVLFEGLKNDKLFDFCVSL